MSTPPAMPAALEVGWLSLDAIHGCTVLDEPRWYDREARWAFRIELACDAPTSTVPPRTRWFVVVDGDYPAGRVEVHPALTGGLTATFPHQAHNGLPERGGHWRSGNICLTIPWTEGRRRDRASPPGQPERRLRWTLERAVEWLSRAASGRLVAPSDPYELPDFDADLPDDLGTIIVPGVSSVPDWLGRASPAWGIAGLKTLHTGPDASRITVVDELRPDLASHGRLDVPWGTFLSQTGGTLHHGAWLWLPAPPRLRPWQAPQKWGELRRWGRDAGVDIERPLAEICARFRTRAGAVVIVGFPIPTQFGGPFEQIAWQALRLPPLRTRAHMSTRGRRRPLAELDRRGPLADDEVLHWLRTTTWSRDRLAVRGVADPTLQLRRVAIIGIGAVGSRLAELLVRAGVRRIQLIDGDIIEAGNLVRHAATLRELGVAKAAALRELLQAASPHAEITAHTATLPTSPADAAVLLGEAELVIDATASDEVLRSLVALSDDRSRLWASVSLNRHAERLYCYLASGPCFPLAAFEADFAPWRSDDARRHQESLPWEGAGCWSPVFPARIDDISTLVAPVVRELERLALDPSSSPRLRVYERRCDTDGTLIELRRRDSPDQAISEFVDSHPPTTCSGPDHACVDRNRIARSNDSISTAS